MVRERLRASGAAHVSSSFAPDRKLSHTPDRAAGVPADLAIDAEVDLCLADGAYFLQARLNVSLPGVEHGIAQTLVDEAHQTVRIPSSRATTSTL
jgi:organic hydroperoxide reductase OsmC/OhrA